MVTSLHGKLTYTIQLDGGILDGPEQMEETVSAE